MQHPALKQKLISLAVAAACLAAAASADAQDAAASTSDSPADAVSSGGAAVQTVVVSGLRQSMLSSLNLKRRADGIVDGIVAEDMGKFPDTNLAESLQRISGVSIDRYNGEGSRITVRGIGPDFNMVLLNGRQMPTSNLGDLSGRAFDFANLASEAIAQLQVYKTSRAETPTGGIGATVNVLTARPLDKPGTFSSIGIKGLVDTSNDNLPADAKAGNSLTPEVSGIYSTTSADGTWGVAVTASYQARHLGVNSASVGGWRGPFRGDEQNWGTIPAANPNIRNHPGATDLYAVPQNLSYSFTGAQRKRTNGQLTLQWAPSTSLTTTLDYTYARNEVQTRQNNMSAWFNFGPSTSTWTDGPIASPLVYTELISPATSDIAMGAVNTGYKTENKSIGFNTQWRVSPGLKLELDAHHSIAESAPDNPYGSSNSLATASFSRGNTTADFSQEFPVLSIQGADFARAPQMGSGSTFQNAYMKGEVDQLQAKGRLRLGEASNLNFGLSATDVRNRSASSNVQNDSWSGLGNSADYPATLWHPETVSQYFDQLAGSDNPNLFNNFTTFNFEEVRAVMARLSGTPERYMPKSTYDTDQRTTEKSRAAYVQLNTDWDTALPMHTALGLRFEKTSVVSTALVPAATSISWVSANELPVAFGTPTFTTLTGRYHNVLPSVDWDVDVRPDMKLRASYGQTIGRPRYDQIAGGQILGTMARSNGGTGNQGNPALKPVKSKNLDLSWEWYYNDQSFFSVNAFWKDLSNYAGQSLITDTPFDLHTPIGGTLYNEAAASGCGSDANCIRTYIFRNHAGAPGVTVTGTDTSGNPTGTIVGQPGDPVAPFQITTYSNQKQARLRGLEVNLQHMFGNSGFGIATNYTYVHSGLRYANDSIGEQFALVGLSDSANVIGIFENDRWTARLAWNWRDKFLSSTFDGTGPNPQYVEPYGQFDLSVGYAVNKQLSLQFEAINLANATTRVHGRTEIMVQSVTQGGPRYMFGARYKF